MPEIDENTLSALLSSIESLRNDVLTLQRSNESLRDDIQTLQECNGVVFPQFKKLPIELRAMIWKWALTGIPQIHVIGDDMCSRSNVNLVAMSCQEAWQVFKLLKMDYLEIKLQLPYPEIPPRPDPSGNDEFVFDLTEPGRYKNYVNLDIDTFWIADVTKLGAGIPININARCGKCVKKSGPAVTDWDTLDERTICPRINSTHFFPIHTMVIDEKSWQNPGQNPAVGSLGDGTLQLLHWCEVQELLIVIGSTQFHPSPHTRFIEPNYDPPENWSNQFMDAEAWGQHWCELGEALEKKFQSFKDKRIRKRNRLFKHTAGVTMEEFDDMFPDLRDLSDWKIPKVRFVQARPAGPEWISPRYYDL